MEKCAKSAQMHAYESTQDEEYAYVHLRAYRDDNGLLEEDDNGLLEEGLLEGDCWGSWRDDF